MKKLAVLFLFTTLSISAKNYYVDVLTGSDSDDGLTPGAAFQHIAFALSLDSPINGPGDNLFIKAGEYGPESVICYKSGSPGRKFTIQGYKTYPGDQPPIVKDAVNPYAALITTDMPTLTKTGALDYNYPFLFADVTNIVVKNIQITGWRFGFTSTCKRKKNVTALEFYNCVVKQGGDDTDDYAGWGFNLGSMGTDYANYCKISNCLIVNVGAEGINLSGDNNIVTDTKVYVNDPDRRTDYMALVTGSYNQFHRFYMEASASLTGNIHGLSWKTNAEQVQDKPVPVSNDTIPCYYNSAFDCVAKNLGEGFIVRHRGAKYNSFYRCFAYGNHTGTGDSGIRGNGITIRDGASHNIFDGCYAEGCESGIRYWDSVEDGDTLGTPGHPSNFNIIKNTIIVNCYIGIYFDGEGIQSDAGNNTIVNSTFHLNRYTIIADRHAVNMKYINCHVGGTLPATPGGSFRNGAYPSDVTSAQFKYCNFYNIQGGMPGGFVAASTGSQAQPPYFIAETSPYNFKLISYSTLRDNGSDTVHITVRGVKKTTLTFVDKDFYSQPRPIGDHIAIGATER